MVRLKDLCGRDLRKIGELCEREAEEFRDAKDFLRFVCGNMTAIGGTATTLGAMKADLKEYDGKKVTGTKITAVEMKIYAEKLLTLPVCEIEKFPCMPKKRADVIGGGAAWIEALMRTLSLSEITVSDEDNLEGYAREKGLL